MQDELIQLLTGRRGHFQLESGYHSEQWFELDRLFADPAPLRPFVAELAARLDRHHIDAVCGPMTGGATLARMIADELGLAYFFTERVAPPGTDGLFPIKYLVPTVARGEIAGRNVAIVDDAISAGSAVRGTYADVMTCSGRPIALGALFVFGETAAGFARQRGLAFEGIAQLPFAMWLPEACPLCRAGAALEKIPVPV